MEDEVNLLPASFQKERMRRISLKRLGRFLRVLSVSLGVLLAGTAGIASFFLVLREEVTRETAGMTDASEALYGEVAATNQFMREFKRDMEASVPWTELLAEALAHVEGMSITALTGESDDMVLEIRGEAASRSAVTDLQRDLEQLAWVEKIEAPLTNFTSGPGTEFSLRLFLAEEL